ncbi:uncharacterized protein K460DRAFT_364130, partial [Cucurbitaria berberidis CBS 394.84]
MSKRLPDTRRDSMNSQFSGNSSQGSPQTPSSVQPHQYRPVMVPATVPTPFMEGNQRRYTQQEIHELMQRQAIMNNQAQLNASQVHGLHRIQAQRGPAGQNGYMPCASPMNPQAPARQLDCQNGQQAGYRAQSSAPMSPMSPSTSNFLASNHPYYQYMRSFQENAYRGQNEHWPVNSPPPFHGSDGYELSERDMLAMSRASAMRSHPNMGRGMAVTQPSQSMRLDPRLYSSSVTGTVPSQLSPRAMGQTPTPRLPTPTTLPSSGLVLPQYAGAKRPSPSGQDAYQEGPTPKRGMFPTTPLSRPNSAQGMVAQLHHKKLSQFVNGKDGRLNKEAVRRGLPNLDTSKQEPNQMKSPDELHRIAQATGALTPGHATQMMGVKNKAIAQEKQTLMTPRRSGATVPTGTPSRPAPTPSPVRKPNVIDLTGGHNQQRQPRPQPLPSKFTEAVNPAAAATPRPTTKRTIPGVNDLRSRALIYGVHMSDVEHGNAIEATIQSRHAHQAEIAAARSLLDPSPANKQRLRRANAKVDSASNTQYASATNNTMDAAHAAALSLPTPFNMQDTLKKVRHPDYSFAYSGNSGGELAPASKEALDMCARDVEGHLRAPEEKETSEELARVRFDLFTLAAERGCMGAKAIREESSIGGV